MSIEAMKQALEALEIYGAMAPEVYDTIADLRTAIAEAEKQEPVAWVVDGEIKVRLDMAGKLYYSETNVYTAPSKREWVGLTHEELAWLNEALNLGGRLAVIEAIEAKLKEKNT
jgi:hypothetical protein